MTATQPIYSATLGYQDDRSDKVYQIIVTPEGSGFMVTCYNGRRGGTLQRQPKTPKPVDRTTALAIASGVYQEKTRKGYTVSADFQCDGTLPADTAPVVTVDVVSSKRKQPVGENRFQPMLLNSITRREADLLVREPAWCAQIKWDGVRAIAHVGALEIQTFSRNNLPVTITKGIDAALRAAFSYCVVDLEVIGEKAVVLDLLACGGEHPLAGGAGTTDLREYEMQARHRALTTLASGLPKRSPVAIVKTAWSTREKEALMKSAFEDGHEGLVFKKCSAPYKAGRPSSGGDGRKLKFKASASLRVIAIGTDGKASVDVALRDGKEAIASVSTIGRKVPKIGDIIEVEYLYAYRGGKLVQPVYKSIRRDVVADTADKLQYKGEER